MLAKIENNQSLYKTSAGKNMPAASSFYFELR
jgi:hypothetical protein